MHLVHTLRCYLCSRAHSLCISFFIYFSFLSHLFFQTYSFTLLSLVLIIKGFSFSLQYKICAQFMGGDDCNEDSSNHLVQGVQTGSIDIMKAKSNTWFEYKEKKIYKKNQDKIKTLLSTTRVGLDKSMKTFCYSLAFMKTIFFFNNKNINLQVKIIFH